MNCSAAITGNRSSCPKRFDRQFPWWEGRHVGAPNYFHEPHCAHPTPLPQRGRGCPQTFVAYATKVCSRQGRASTRELPRRILRMKGAGLAALSALVLALSFVCHGAEKPA